MGKIKINKVRFLEMNKTSEIMAINSYEYDRGGADYVNCIWAILPQVAY